MTLNESEKLRLLRTLQEDPAFLEQIRSLVLSDELRQLPERLAQFAASVTNFIAEQQEFNADQKQFNAEQKQFNAEQKQFNADQKQFNTEQREFNARIDRSIARLDNFVVEQKQFNAEQREFNAAVTHRLQRITDDLGDLKGHVAGRLARDRADDIAASLGCRIIAQLDGADLRELVRRQDNAADIPFGQRRSFYNADLVIQVRDPAGAEFYLAGEASYTADIRDVQRAQRNAEFLTKFTGLNATPLIISLRNDHAVDALIDQGVVRWFQFDQRDLQPE